MDFLKSNLSVQGTCKPFCSLVCNVRLDQRQLDSQYCSQCQGGQRYECQPDYFKYLFNSA